MTLQEANKVLSKIKFLHYKFEIRPTGPHGFELIITAAAPDTRNRRNVIDIRHIQHLLIDDITDNQMLIEQVWICVLSSLGHEAGELFFVDGQDPYNQHESNQKKWGLINAMFTKETGFRTYQENEAIKASSPITKSPHAS